MENTSAVCSQKDHSIEILNFEDGQKVSYSIVVIEGKVKTHGLCQSENQVKVEHINGPCWSPKITHHKLAATFDFKCILRLEHGCNTFNMQYCSAQLELVLHFAPKCTPFCVIPVYVICKGHDGRFQAPEGEDNSINSACDRIDTGLRLLQSLMAERLQIGGYGRQTFQLQADADPSAPDCHVFYSDISVEEAYTVPAKTLWSRLGRELMTSHLGRVTHKFVAFLSCTYYKGISHKNKNITYDDILAHTEGHVALGGGGLALFGTACLHTWACSVEEVVPRLLNSTQVDPSIFMDNSNYRGTYGGCFATTLGAVCHELGHTFDLGHTSHGIMGTEYHNINHMFLPEVQEARKGTTQLNNPPQDMILSLQTKQQDLIENSKATKSKITDLQLQNIISNLKNIPTREKQSTLLFVPDLKFNWDGPIYRALRVETPIAVPHLQTPTSPSKLGTCIQDQEHETRPATPNSESKDSNSNTQACAISSLQGTIGNDQNERLLLTNKQVCTDEKKYLKSDSEIHLLEYFAPTYDSEDLTPFWAESCLAILAYNKWINLNSSEEKNGCISFDKSKNLVSSIFDVKVVDLRDTEFKSVLHWKFTQNSGITKFNIPEDFIKPNIHNIVVIDSVGNVLKETFHKLELLQ